VLAVRAPGVAQVELPNGHRLIAHRARRLRGATPPLAPGDPVTVQLSPGDLSHGRIRLEQRLET
jgi:translation initiation factor IF-1